jgi:hypothetical protein
MLTYKSPKHGLQSLKGGSDLSTPRYDRKTAYSHAAKMTLTFDKDDRGRSRISVQAGRFRYDSFFLDPATFVAGCQEVCRHKPPAGNDGSGVATPANSGCKLQPWRRGKKWRRAGKGSQRSLPQNKRRRPRVKGGHRFGRKQSRKNN